MSLHVLPDLEQGSPEWHDQRRGMVTASVVGRLLTIGTPDATNYDCPACGVKAGESCTSLSRKTPTPLKTSHTPRIDVATARGQESPPVIEVADNETSRALTATLVAERISGFTEDTPMTSDMWRGVGLEPIARDTYYDRHAPVTTAGFMVRDDWGFRIGYSPDGLVGDDGLIEIKAPRAKTHVLTVLADEVPMHHMAQLQTGLLVSGRQWIDFIPFVGGLPMWVKRVYPDMAWFAAIEEAVTTFEANAAVMVAAYETATTGLAPTERVLELEMSL
jgi:hypothetical protein